VGGYVSNDNLAVLRDAENPVLAHMFLNFMLDNKVAIKNYSWNAYQPPINALEPSKLVEDGTIIKNLETAVIDQGDFNTGQVPQQLTPEEDKQWLEAWSRVQQGG
jgi:spermidine/putrescine-binding protein